MAVQVVDTPRRDDAARSPGRICERPGLLRRYPQFTISPAILVALVAVWWFATDVLGVPAYILPPPEAGAARA